MDQGFSVGTCLKRAWSAYKQNWIFLVVITVVLIMFPSSPNLLIFFLFKPSAYTITMINLAQLVLTVYLLLGYYHVALRLGGGQPVRLYDPFSCFPSVLNYIFAKLFFAVLFIAWSLINYIPYIVEMIVQFGWEKANIHMMIDNFVNGLFTFNPIYTFYAWLTSEVTDLRSILLILHSTIYTFVSVWLFLAFWFVPFVLVDHTMGPIDAMKESYKIIKGSKWDLFALLLVGAVITAGVIICTIGIGLIFVLPIIYIAQGAAFRHLKGG